MEDHLDAFVRATLSDNLRYLRVSHNLTQSAIASILGISRSTYSMLERGMTQMTLKQAYLICRLYDLTVQQLTFEPLFLQGAAAPAAVQETDRRGRGSGM